MHSRSIIFKYMQTLFCASLVCVCAITNASAQDWMPGDQGKLLATGGVSQVEGAGGAGLSPWALITGYGTRDSYGANIHHTFVALPDFSLHTTGVAVGLYDRVEISYAHLWFDTQDAGAALGLGQGFTFEQDVIGLKVRLLGDAIYNQDRWLPQISAGLQYKKTQSPGILSAVGAVRDNDFDYYLSATKLFMGQSILASATVRFTRANQLGLLGYGGDQNDQYRAQFEGSVAYLFSRDFAVGADYRMKPNNLGFAEEDDAFDIFAAYFFSKHVSFTAAYADLGEIALQGPQRGAYFSLQVGF